MSNDILCEIRDNIATVTLNRPQLLNAFTEKMAMEGRKIFDGFAENDAVRSVVLTGAGKNFSAGGDLKSFKEAIDSQVYLTHDFISKVADWSKSILACPKPVIAMINGAAAGAGCGLALACDLRVMTEKTRFVMGFINMGLGGDAGSIYNLVRIVGMGRAREMLMLGEPVGGKDALAMGLANRLAEEGQLEETTYALAARLASLPTRVFRQQKEILFASFYGSFPACTKMEIDSTVAGSRGADFAEAVHAFLEKRPANFTGKRKEIPNI